MSAHDDLDLRGRFASLRESDAAQAPSFASMRHAPPAPRRASWLAATAFATAALITFVLLLRSGFPGPPSLDEAISQAKALSSWSAPTDDLLIVADLAIPDTVPSLSPSSVSLPDATGAATDSGDSR